VTGRGSISHDTDLMDLVKRATLSNRTTARIYTHRAALSDIRLRLSTYNNPSFSTIQICNCECLDCNHGIADRWTHLVLLQTTFESIKKEAKYCERGIVTMIISGCIFDAPTADGSVYMKINDETLQLPITKSCFGGNVIQSSISSSWINSLKRNSRSTKREGGFAVARSKSA
jgi:hypothetical protein